MTRLTNEIAHLAPSAGKRARWLFRAEKRNKHARDLAARQAPSLNGGNFVVRVNKSYDLFNVLFQFNNLFTSLIESWCILFLGNIDQFFRTKSTDLRFGTFPAIYKKFVVKTYFFPQTHLTYCIHISKPLNILATESLSR